MVHYVYQIDNLINGKYYRGKHSAKSLDNDYMGSGTLIRAAIEKYGVGNFKKTILKTFPTGQEAYDYEAEVVTMKEVNDPMCYNLQVGGKGGQKRFTDEELKEHRLESIRKYKSENKEKVRKACLNNYTKNKTRRLEQRHRWYAENKDKAKEYYQTYYKQNREKINEYHRTYQQENRKEYQHEYQQENRERINKLARERYQRDKEKIKEYKREYNRKLRERNKNNK